VRVSAAAIISCLWLEACGRAPAGASLRPDSRLEARAAAAAKVAPATPNLELRLPFDSSNGPAWVELLRMERWAEAARSMDAEPALLRDKPEARYARAAAAEHLGEAERVVALLSGLESQLPLLAERIRERRARAALSAGDPRETLAVFKARADAESQLLTARATEAVEGPDKARAVLEGLLRKLPRRSSPCSIEAPARAELARLLEARSLPLARREYRWLAVQAPLCASGDPALARLAELSGPALDRAERQTRAQAFADAGAVARAENELGALVRAKGPPLEPGMLSYFQGWARYSGRTDLLRAVEALSSAARANRAQAPAWLFYAGRAASRLGDADRARSLFERVGREHPDSSFAEAGQYQVAQTHYEHGRFREAASAFDAYLARHGRRGRYGDEAFDERAVAWLASGKAEAAARSFDELRRPTSGLERARYDELLAVAQLRAGKRTEAVAALRAVVSEYPLTFAALAAEARLRALGEAAPPLVAGPGVSQPGPLLPAVPNVARLLHAVGLDVEAEKELGRTETAISSAHPGRGDEALCLAYSELSPKSRAYRVGSRTASRAELMALPAPGREWLWNCVYPRPYTALVSEIGGQVSVEPELIYAIIRQESAFRPDAVSPAAAIGLMQLLPSTAERVASENGLVHMAERLTEPPVNIGYGARYLRKLLDLFGGNVALAAASYNAGPTAVLRWLEGAPDLDLDLFVARIPFAETRAYVERVVGNYARYLYLRGDSPQFQLSLELPRPIPVDPSTLY
jgi:soluble lytic murein transglycosylase